MLLITDTCQTIGNKVHGIFYKRLTYQTIETVTTHMKYLYRSKKIINK